MSQESNNIGMNELVDYKKVNYGKGMRTIKEFLWKCGGSDKKILEYAPYSDHIKHAGIGGVVLATTVMAMLAMGFAMHTIFASPDPFEPTLIEFNFLFCLLFLCYLRFVLFIFFLIILILIVKIVNYKLLFI